MNTGEFGPSGLESKFPTITANCICMKNVILSTFSVTIKPKKAVWVILSHGISMMEKSC